MRKQLLILGISIWVVVSFGCDPGSVIELEPEGDTQCRATLESNTSMFSVEMLLGCDAAAHSECYTIEELTCDGEEVELSEPIAIESCPGEDGWCIDECVEGPEGGNGAIWDTPELLAIDDCNIYEQEGGD